MKSQEVHRERDHRCFRCGKELPAGSLSYITQIRIFAGFDGVLLEPEEGVDQQFNQLLKQVEEANPEDLEKEVYQEFHLILCKSCRDRLVEEIEHPWGNPGRFVH